MTNYTDIAMESLLCESPMWRSATVNRIVAESEFILASLESGSIENRPVVEAISADTAKKALEMLRGFLNTVMVKFKGKVADYYEKYIPWVEKNAENIKKAAEKGSITLAPYWKGNIAKDQSDLSKLPTEAFKTQYEMDDVSFATSILSSIKTPEDMEDTAKVSNILKNKYRFGIEEEDNSKIKKEVLEGNGLANQIDGMIKYVSEYKKISDALSNISKNWEKQAENFQKGVTESTSVLTKDTFFLVESAALRCTDLCLLEGMNSLPNAVMEEEGNDNKNTSLTGVEDNKKDNGVETPGGTKPSGGGQGRYRLADKFVRLAYSAFMTACEERFIVYIKVMSKILGESPKGPKEKEDKK